MFVKTENLAQQKGINAGINPLSPQKDMENIDPNAQKASEIKPRQNLEVNLQYLALAISTNRTRVHFGQRHYCIRHSKVVDKHHIDVCDLLKGKFTPTEFNIDLNEKGTVSLSPQRYNDLRNHLLYLEKVIAVLENNEKYLSVKTQIRSSIPEQE